MTEAISTQAAAQLVPASYAEKAMASLMQLHSELMDEKERRVELFRRLMEREQALAELRMYVKILEEKASGSKASEPSEAQPVAAAASPPGPGRASPPPQFMAKSDLGPSAAPPSGMPPRATQIPPVPPRAPPRSRIDGWKSW